MIIIRIGKITLDGYSNYGNLLQNYALQQVLLKYADTVDTIWHEKEQYCLPGSYRLSWKEIIKFMLDWNNFRAYYHKQHLTCEIERQKKIKRWSDKYIHIRTGITNLYNIANEYDYFVVGSDQVWHPRSTLLNNTFLSFAPFDKRIAYAASIAAPEIPEDKKIIFQNGLNGMKWISMREQEGADIVKQLTGRDVPVVVDPTMLLTLDEWRKVSQKPAWYHGDDYILTYFLGSRPNTIIQQLASKNGLSVVNLLDENMYEYYVTGIDEFIWSIEHASLIYTDSFHGTVFSILFQRPFVVCDRKDNGIFNKMSSRIDTLLAYFGLEERRGTQDNNYLIDNPMHISYRDTQAVFQKERKRADAYLRKALNVK
jgi:hypothetical protein